MSKAGWFHPMSNNLYDEEIAAAYETRGIIGICLEERALGGGKRLKTGRYRGGSANYKDETMPSLYDTAADRVFNRFFAGYHGNMLSLKDSLAMAEPFVRNLFYIVEHSGYAKNDTSWMHVALGSDLDGYINPIDLCPTAASYPGFYQFLCRTLPFFGAYIWNKEADAYFCHQKPEVLLDNVFYKNGERFIKTYF